ncbi:MAG: 2-oxoacid:ferredoxin oxidoreductase subunit beta [Elusimicrobia bacterium]|nr:2-oxoacid:ferredoxin oxidoreductase subunit beta [Elusimicrobiota bacterium]
MEEDITALPASGPMLSRKDFVSDQLVRWCPGCGDFAILATIQKLLPSLGIPREKYVFVSGIGCSSRFPYYMNTYGFHSIHGRAPTFATGLKCVRPDLQVWVVTGDGDGLSIGGNHLIHALRRNVDIKILLFNNKIYGLTKGQTSPTSEQGKKTKSTPQGSVDYPVNPVNIALASEATFVARAVDTDLPFLTEVLRRAALHKGLAFVEIFQNCIVFNDGAWAEVSEKALRDDTTLTLQHGKPLVFGKDKNRGIRLKNGFVPETVEFEPGKPPRDLLVHDEKAPNATLAHLIAHLERPYFPVPQGVFRSVERPVLHELIDEQVAQAKKAGSADLQKLLAGSENWVVRSA